ncbi:MAG: molybdopterin-guanine dinucleotide biosynthesis protein MobB [Pirellulaceae bacterium]
MKRLYVIGRKHHGKTTLESELIIRLSELGYRVGTIKHTHHQSDSNILALVTDDDCPAISCVRCTRTSLDELVKWIVDRYLTTT